MSLGEAYYYLFFKIYRWFDTPWMASRAKYNAVSIIILLELSVPFSFLNYRTVIVKHHSRESIFSLEALLPLVIVMLINVYAFAWNDDWKGYVQKFDQWPQEKNRKGGWIVGLLMLVIFSNFIISCVLFSPYRGT